MTVTTLLPISEAEAQSLRELYERNGQGHVFLFYDGLPEQEKQQLLKQLLEIDVERVNFIYNKAVQAVENTVLNQHVSKFEPLPETVFESVLSSSPEKIQEWESIGLDQIAEGKVAVILMAGGQGTRLGSSDPKGCYDINLPSRKTLFQLQAERILRLQEIARQHAKRTTATEECIIPWYIMTSGPTHAPTVEFFAKNDYFGVKKENIIFFEQGVLPCLTMDGRIILEDRKRVAMAPDGNGGIYAALHNKGVIKSLKERGILYSHCYCVDNCLVRVADPVFIGYSVSKNTDCGVKVVSKLDPHESVGVVCQRDGKYGVVEYSEISTELAEMRKADGSLQFGAANIANHFFSTEFLERVPTFADRLEYHIAKKKIKYIDFETGELVVPKSNSGMKLECFVFDVFPFAESFSVLEVDRKDEFSPLKNGPGSGFDCPETCRRDIVAQHVRFIEAAGGKVVGEDAENFEQLQFELSSLVTYAGEGLADHVNGKAIMAAAIIETRDDLINLSR